VLQGIKGVDFKLHRKVFGLFDFITECASIYSKYVFSISTEILENIIIQADTKLIKLSMVD